MTWNPPDHFAQLLIRHMREAVVVTDEGFRVVAWLGAAEEIFGYSAAEADGKHVLEDFGFRFPDGEAEAHTERMLAGEPVRANVQALRKDNRWIDLDVTIEALRDPSGARIGTFSVARDVTEQRKLEQKLRESEQLYRSAITVMDEGVLVVDRDARIRAVNPAVLQLHGVEADKLLGRDPEGLGWSFLHEDGREFAREELPAIRALRGEHVRHVLGRIVIPGGRKAWVSLSAQPLSRAADGSVQSVMVSVSDITALREQDARIRQDEQRLRLVLEGSNDGFWDWDIPSGALTLSARWATMLGYVPEELSPRVSSWTALVHPDDLPRVRGILDRHVSGETPLYETEYRMRAKDGTWRWILARGKVVERNTHGLPVRAAGTHTDVTSRHEAEERLRAALAENEQIVHQLRDALENVKTLRGLLPICSKCKKVRPSTGEWEQIEMYVARHTDAQFSHGYCEVCLDEEFPPEQRKTGG